MKKIIFLILLVSFIFLMSSCQSSPATHTPYNTTPNYTPDNTQENITAEKLKVFSDFIKNNLEIYDNGNISFLNLTKSLTCNNKIISEACSIQKNEFSTGTSYSINGGSLFSFSETFKTYADGTLISSTDFFITEYVSGLEFPFNITFDDSLDSALNKIIVIDISKDFKANEGSDTDMTLYSAGNKSIIYRDHNKNTQIPDSTEASFEIIYINNYKYTNKNGIEQNRSEKISFLFDNHDKFLIKIQAEVEDRHKIPVSQIPVQTPTPTPTLTPIPEVTGVFYDYKLSLVPYSDSNINIIDNIDNIFEYSLNKKTNNLTLPIFICDTFEEFDKVRRIFFGDINYDEKIESVYDYEGLIFVNNTIEYREEFFKDHSLVMVYKIAGSGSYRYGSKCLAFTPTGLCVYVERTDNNSLGSDDMKSWFITVEIDDASLEGITDFNAVYFPY